MTECQDGEFDEYSMYCFAFGFEGGKLKHPGSPITVRDPYKAVGMARTLANLSGTEPGTGKSLIHELFPVHIANIYNRKVNIDSEDLLVFVCRDTDSFSVSQQAQARLDRLACLGRTFWIYVNDGEPEIRTEFQRRKAES